MTHSRPFHIAIVGCGYVGSEVALKWTQQGYHVTGTTRNPEKLAEIGKVTQKAMLIKENGDADFAPLITSNEVILVSISADTIHKYESAYLHTAQAFRHLALEMDLPRRLIYTSSTSVYGDHMGRWVDEESELLGATEQAKVLIETENTYLSLVELGWHVCILRLAEIYGPGREISQKVREAQNVALPGDGSQYTNMVHRADCAGAIDYVLRHHLEGIYNLADDDHPTRKVLYSQVAENLHFPPPIWDAELSRLHSGNKRISNHKIKAEGFTFRFPQRELK